MVRRNVTVLSALLVLAATSVAEGQEIMLEGPLAGAPACRECIQYRNHRFTVSPLFNFTLLDDYRRHIFIGARLEYHFTDWLGVAIAGAYGGFWGDSLDTGLTQEVADKAPNGIESNRANYPFPSDTAGAEAARAQTTNLLGRMLGYASIEVMFIPLRGKLGLFSRLFLDVDLYVFLGYSFTFVEERANVDCRDSSFIQERGYQGGRIPDEYGGNAGAFDAAMAQRCPWVGSSGDVADVQRADPRLAVNAGTYGLGVSIYTNDWLAVNLEYRVMPILWNPTGTDERGMALVNDTLTFCPSDAAEGEPDYCGDTGEFPDRRINENDRRWSANHMFTLGVTFHFPTTPRRSN
jgi:outer membrane beta-barrel protein